MMRVHQGWAEWSAWWWAAVGDHLWQATLLAGGALIVTLLLRHAPARIRHSIWLIVIAKAALPSVLFSLVLTASGIELPRLRSRLPPMLEAGQFNTPVVVDVISVEGEAAPVSQHSEIPCLLSLVWTLGGAVLLFRWRRLRRQLKIAISAGCELEAGPVYEALGQAAMKLGIKRHVRVVGSAKIGEPSVWGVWRPVIVLPEGISEHLCAAELEAVLSHELVHLRRRDNLVSSCQFLACSLWWFFPLVWLVDRQLLAERERACDEEVLRLGCERRVYAASLLKVVQLCYGRKVAGVAGMVGSNLTRRIKAMMHENQSRKLMSWHRALLGGVIAAASLLSVVPILSGQDRMQTTPDPDLAPQDDTVSPEVKAARTVLEQYPEVHIGVKNPDQGPILITEATTKIVPTAVTDRLGLPLLPLNLVGPGAPNGMFVKITGANVGTRRVRSIIFTFSKDDKDILGTSYNASLEPGGSFTLGVDNILWIPWAEDTVENLSVKVSAYVFDDESSSGEVSRVEDQLQPATSQRQPGRRMIIRNKVGTQDPRSVSHPFAIPDSAVLGISSSEPLASGTLLPVGRVNSSWAAWFNDTTDYHFTRAASRSIPESLAGLVSGYVTSVPSRVWDFGSSRSNVLAGRKRWLVAPNSIKSLNLRMSRGWENRLLPGRNTLNSLNGCISGEGELLVQGPAGSVPFSSQFNQTLSEVICR